MAREEKLSKTQLETDLDVAQTFLVTDPSKLKYAFCAANCQLLADACYDVEKPVTAFSLGRIFSEVEHRLAVNPAYAAAYREFFTKTPEFDDSDANRNLLDAAFLGKGLNHRELSAEDLANILPNTQGLSVTAEALQDESDRQERKRILKECIARLVDADGKPKLSLCRGNLSPQGAYRQEVERINSLSLDELRAIKQKREDAAKLRGMSVEELRIQARQEFQATRPSPGRFLPLPEKFIPPGKSEECGVPFTRALLTKLDPKTLRYLTERHGFEVINEILNGTRR